MRSTAWSLVEQGPRLLGRGLVGPLGLLNRQGSVQDALGFGELLLQQQVLAIQKQLNDKTATNATNIVADNNR